MKIKRHYYSPYHYIITNYLLVVKVLLTCLIGLIVPLCSCELDSKIGKLFVVPVCPTHGEDHLQKVRNLLTEKKIGGVIFMEGESNIQIELVRSLQDEADSSLLTFQDAEWGVGMRLYDIPNLPKNMTLGAIDDLELLRSLGLEMARGCRLAGIQGDFAPCCDVNTNPKNPVIGMRAFGDDPGEVARRSLAVMKGMQEGGLLTCAKHFPGHGDTSVDSHLDIPKIDQVQLVPFQRLIDAGVDLVMMGHLYCPHLSREPASLSYEITTELLREKLGFNGVVITDALNMGALLKHYSIEEIVEKALLAGSDLLLFSTANTEMSAYLIEEGIPRAIDHIKKTIPEALIDEKLKRIETLRNRSIPSMPEEDKELRRLLYRKAVTKIGCFKTLGGKIALVRNHDDRCFENLLRRYTNVTLFSYDEIDLASEFENLVIEMRDGDHLENIPEHGIVALFNSPYALSHPKTLLAFEDVIEAKEAVADILYGQLNPSGKIPIKLTRVSD